MRLLIAGWQGQVAHALVEAAPGCADIEACAVGRPALDLCKPQSVERALADIRPDIVINSAAYTAVDQAEKVGVPPVSTLFDDVFAERTPQLEEQHAVLKDALSRGVVARGHHGEFPL